MCIIFFCVFQLSRSLLAKIRFYEIISNFVFRQWTFTMWMTYLCVCFHFFFFFFVLMYRIAGSRSKMGRFSITKDCRTVRRTIMPNVVHFVLAAANQLLDDASRQCSANSIPNILYAHSVWNNWTRERSKSKTISHIVMSVSINSLVNRRVMPNQRIF